MITNKTFDWDKTRKDLLIFIPNFGRSRYIRKTIDNLIDTSVSRERWIVLIINDGIHEDFSNLTDKNVVYFTLERNPPIERNGGFVRNIAIKYSQSKMIAQRDPEILYTNDFIKNCFDNPGVLYRCGKCSYSCNKNDTNLYFDNQIDANELQRRTRAHPITEEYVCWHWGHCAPLESFKKLNGYDESFTSWGYEDADMYDRLMKSGLKQYLDCSCNPIHLYHEKPGFNTNPKDIKDYEEMRNLYTKKKNANNIIANQGMIWGDGGINYSPEDNKSVSR